MQPEGFRRIVKSSSRRKRHNRKSRAAKQSPPLPASRIALVGKGAVSGIRRDLVARVRAEIAAGVYDSPEKFELAFSRMVEVACAE